MLTRTGPITQSNVRTLRSRHGLRLRAVEGHPAILRNIVCVITIWASAGARTPARGQDVAPVTILDSTRPGTWQSDGMWRVRTCGAGVEFLKDKTAVHNSMCWTKLPTPLRRGETIEITYRMEVPYKHVDLVLGRDLTRGARDESMPEFAEVLSLGDLESTHWQTQCLTVTSSDAGINTLGFLAWGWPVDRGTWMRVVQVRRLPARGSQEWFVWRVPPHENERSIPARNPLQDFFPFGVTFHMEFARNYRYEGLKDRWEWIDRCLADIAARGMNYVFVGNLGEADLERVIELHVKHGLLLTPQVGQFDVKHNGQRALKPFIRAVAKYRGHPAIAGWSVGEEFQPEQMHLLELPQEIVHAVDPANTLATVQCRTDCFKISGETLDVRVQFRDLYPFFADPANGPTTFEASMRCFEDAMNRSQCLLPRGASLWAMPQGSSAYLSDKKMFLFRMPNPAEIKLQAWTALGIGAQGLAYYLYPSHPPRHEGEPSAILGLRTHDGKPTPQLEALTELAAVLVPLGPVITKWGRTRVPAATDRRELRAFLFSGKDGVPHLVVYNRDVNRTTTGRVRVPFACDAVLDLPTRKRRAHIADGSGTVFELTLPPGDGTILQLSGRLPEPLAFEGVDEPHVCGRPRPDLPLASLADGRRVFRYEADFQATRGVPAAEALPDDLQFQDWSQAGKGDRSMNGLWGRRFRQLYEMPDDITAVSVDAVFANYADAKERTYRVRYSTDGEEFVTVAETASSGAARIPVQGKALLPAGTRKLWVSHELPARSIGIVLKRMRVDLTLRAAAEAAPR